MKTEMTVENLQVLWMKFCHESDECECDQDYWWCRCKSEKCCPVKQFIDFIQEKAE